MATSHLDYPYPQVAPGTLRDAFLIATAFEDAARSIAADFPLTARMLRARAAHGVAAMQAATTSEARQRDARGRWVSRSTKVGPRVTPGPAHVTVATGRGQTTDLAHRTICGKTLTGRSVSFGPPATGADDCPPTWTPCRGCLHALDGHPDPAVELFDETLDLTPAGAA